MSSLFSALKGMQDILPDDIYIWQSVESAAKKIFSSFGFKEIRTPVAESTAIFSRGIGESTDIVEKEMYTFNDRAGRSITLRPEGTASVVRSYVQNHLYNEPSPQKYFYTGPMFRYERPQSGRFRQFYQIGVEAFGSAHPEMDAEVISMLRHFLMEIGLGKPEFQVNSIGCSECRPVYRESLRNFLAGNLNSFCPDCIRRFDNNPLRILDCKVEKCINLRKGAPSVTESLCGDCRNHFNELLLLLGRLDISFAVNNEMVRGIDYYTRTTFEVKGEGLGAQNAVAAGGRYDRLVKEFGGPEIPAVGFAVGLERTVELLKETALKAVPSPDVFIAVIGKKAARESVVIADRIRMDRTWVEIGDSYSSLKSQLRRADRLKAGYVFILGDEELDSEKIKWKRLKDSAEGEITFQEISAFLKSNL